MEKNIELLSSKKQEKFRMKNQKCGKLEKFSRIEKMDKKSY
jgi:hypothetical protein